QPSASSTGASSSSGSAHNRQHNQGNQERKYTVEQKAAVLRIRRCSPTAFYEILELQKTCTDAEIKKAYRKQSLLTHPDKNGHEHADEAFKMVARAFSVLGDKEKRDKFDRFGTDPDNRFASAGGGAGGAAGNPFAGFGRRAASGGAGGPGFGGGGMWEEEISPEEMFQRFFGGGGFNVNGFGGAAFDAGPQFFFNLGGPGVRVHQFGGARPRGRPRNPTQPGQPEEEPSIFNTLIGLLPILLLFIFPILSSLFADSGPKLPTIIVDNPEPPYTMQRMMPQTSTRYFLDPKEVAGWTTQKLNQLDKQAEVQFVNNLGTKCEQERANRAKLEDEAQGWFKADPAKMAIAQAYPMPACQRLRSMNVRI
ncbi:DnaJ domain containing protein, partial [Naviculisporaceae sp. PSN 640]